MAHRVTSLQPGRWTLRDFIAAVVLFAATAAVVLWQNAHVAVLWDLSYLLDSSFRISLGQMPYRDFPFAHAPLTFLIQAAIIRCTGRVFFHHVVYAAIVSGLGTVITWRLAWHTLQGRLAAAWSISLIFSTPLIVLGIYCIYPHPIYDCDCIFSILVAILLLQRLQRPSARLRLWAVAAGMAIVVPVFFKQNIGLPFLLTVCCGLALLVALRLIVSGKSALTHADVKTWMTVLLTASATMLLALLLLHRTVGIGNYIHWTVKFAAERRLPGFGDMLDVYAEPSLRWTLPCVAAAFLLLQSRLSARLWTRVLALALLASPFVATLLFLLMNNDSGDRASSLLALWPLVLVVSAVMVGYQLRRGFQLSALFPLALLAAIHGTLLSQQLWGSTYALWPLLVLLLAQMLASFGPADPVRFRMLTLTLTSIIATTLLVCGSLYAASEDRLSYAEVTDGPLKHSSLPPLRGMALRGSALPDFEELIHFAAAEIPANDGLLLINGEDPFYFTTGRTPQFPVLLFDKATDPYSPAQVAAEARARNIRWLIVKRNLQMKEDPTPQRAETLMLLSHDFVFYRGLENYDIFRRP